MVRHDGGRWDIGVKDNAINLERISGSDERVFDDLLEPAEARELAGLLTKYADKLDESDTSEDSDDAEDSDKSDKSDKSKDSDKSKKKDSEDSEDSEDSKDSD
jgi:hypothetical protein